MSAVDLPMAAAAIDSPVRPQPRQGQFFCPRCGAGPFQSSTDAVIHIAEIHDVPVAVRLRSEA